MSIRFEPQLKRTCCSCRTTWRTMLRIRYRNAALLERILVRQPPVVLLLYAGISNDKGLVHVMYVFNDGASSAAFDDTIGLAFKLPTQEEDA